MIKLKKKTREYYLLLDKKKDYESLNKLKCANSYFARLKGLMFKKNIDYIFLLNIKNKNNRFFSSIHTFFMRFKINVVFLDEKKKVLEIAIIPPWRIYFPKFPAKYILEGTCEIFKSYNIAIGDRLDFILI